MKKMVSIKEYKEMNGRKVPIYKYDYISDEDYKEAKARVAKMIEEANAASPEDKKPEEIIEILKEHAEETVKDVAVEQA